MMLWDAPSGALVRTFLVRSIVGVGFSPDGRHAL